MCVMSSQRMCVMSSQLGLLCVYQFKMRTSLQAES